MLTVEDVIARIPAWTAAASLRVTPLGGGITNESYRVEVDRERFVVRIGGRDAALLGIDRERERVATAEAARLGVAPELVLALPEAAVLVTRYVDGRVLGPSDVREPATLGRIVETLRRFHAGPAIPGRFSAFRAVEAYRDVAAARGVALPSGLDGWLALARGIEAALPAADLVPCHNDLLPANFIDDGRRLWILDWEYAAMGNPFFDLGNLAANAELGPGEEGWLIGLYGLGAAPGTLARLRLMRLVSDLREATWGLVQVGISGLAFDFAGYAARHFERVAARADEAAAGLP